MALADGNLCLKRSTGSCDGSANPNKFAPSLVSLEAKEPKQEQSSTNLTLWGSIPISKNPFHINQ